MSIELTESAAEEVKSVLEQQRAAAANNGEESKARYLRVGVRGGGCGGFSYALELAEAIEDEDEHWSQHGVELICDSRSHIYIDGSTIDFRNDETARGFVVNNPNPTSSCGCSGRVPG